MDENERLVRESLEYAEQLYGKALAPAAFHVEEVFKPRHADWDRAKNHVTIQIPLNMNQVDRKGELAHEAFHVFSPATRNEGTYFGEGLATLLAIEQRNYHPFPDDIKYREAVSLVRRLIAMCPDSVEKLLSARKRISLVTADDIAAICKGFPASDAQHLVRKFFLFTLALPRS